MSHEGCRLQRLRQSITRDQVSAEMGHVQKSLFFLLMTVMVSQRDMLCSSIKVASVDELDSREIVLSDRDGQIDVDAHVFGKLSEKSQFSCTMINC